MNTFAAPLLRRAHVEPHRPLDCSRLDLLGDGDRRRERRDAEQMMPAGVPVAVAAVARLAERHRLLRQLRQRVELAQDADDRLAAAELGGERGGDAGDVPST